MFGTLLLATVIGWEHLKVACGLSTTVAYRNLGNRTFFNTSIHAENRYGQLWIGYRLDLGPGPRSRSTIISNTSSAAGSECSISQSGRSRSHRDQPRPY